MKKIFLIAFVVVLVFSFISCGSTSNNYDDVIADLQEQINELQYENNALKLENEEIINENSSIKVQALKSGQKTEPEETPVQQYIETETDTQTETVYWVPNGKVWHTTQNCSTLSRSHDIRSGTIEESGKSRCCKKCG